MPFLGKTPSQIVDPEVDIDGGTIDGVSIGSVTANAGAFTNLTATGTLTLPDDGISGDDVNGGTISNFASTGIDDNATSTAITIDSSQRVGIGATTLSHGLQVGTSASGQNLGLYSSSYASNGLARFYGTDSVERLQIGSLSATAAYLYTPASTDLTFFTGGSQNMTLDASGNLGLGTLEPLQLLHISKASADNYIRLGSNGANDAGIYFNTATDWTIGTDASNSNAFVLSNSSTVGGLSNVVVTTLGNMGIAGTPQSFGGGVTTLQLKGLSSSQPTRAGALRFISNNGTSCDTAIYSDNGFMSFYTGTSTSQSLNLQIDAYGGLNIKSVAGTQAATFGGSNLVNGITGLPSSAGVPFVVGRDTGTLRSAHFAGYLKFDSGYGIDFDVSGGSGVTVSSNVLDDYEEGTFTAYLGFSGGDSGGLNYTNQTFAYTKVGRLVTFTGFLTWNQNNFTSASGRMYLRGLPFTIINGGSYRGGAGIHYANSPWTNITVYQQEFRSEDGTTDMTFNFADATDGSIDSEITTYTRIALSGNFMVSGTYMTN